MPEKYSCPKCGKELTEENITAGLCPYCHKVFDLTLPTSPKVNLIKKDRPRSKLRNVFLSVMRDALLIIGVLIVLVCLEPFWSKYSQVLTKSFLILISILAIICFWIVMFWLIRNLAEGFRNWWHEKE